MLFRSQCYFFGVLIFLCFSYSTYIQVCLPELPALPKGQSFRKEEKGRKELYSLRYVCSFQVPSVHLHLAFLVLQLAVEMDALFHAGINQPSFSASLHLLQTWAGSKQNAQLQAASRPAPAGQCQTVCCKALHSLQTKPVPLTFPIQSMWYKCNIGRTFY